MRKNVVAGVLFAFVAACGSDGSATNPGTGTKTLVVEAKIDYEAGADFDVRVRRAGQDVTDAVVTITSNRGEVLLTHDGGGDYIGAQTGWGNYFALDVKAGPDALEGSIAAPQSVTLVQPDMRVPFDARQAESVRFRWDAEPADFVRIKTEKFETVPEYVEDTGSYMIVATAFVDTEQDVKIKRRNSVALAGGLPGSTLTADYEEKFQVLVTNPYSK
jgi:hypothetical protein